MARLSAPFASLLVIAGGATMMYIYFFTTYFYDMDVMHLEDWMRVNFTSFLVNTPGCQIPDWDPFHPTVNVYYKNPGEFECKANASLVSVMDGNKLVISKSVLYDVYNYYPVSDISCSYRPILRTGDSADENNLDDRFKLGNRTKFLNNARIPEDYVFVECFHRGLKPFYSEYFPLIPVKESVEKMRDKQADVVKLRHNLSIIIQGVDSISRLNFLRHFPKTHKFLLKDLGAFELGGYTKVGENTFPNLVPFLTGHFYTAYYNASTTPNMYFDDLPFAWKEYANAGYRTLLAEDSPSIATFNYIKNGFKIPPTDYYLRPYALATEVPSVRIPATKHCVGNKMELDVVFNYSRSFITKFKDKRFFAFGWVARLTHDNMNYAGYVDRPAVKFLREIEATGVLNNSILIFMSDHGIRFGDILLSYLGKFEERTPFMYLVFPKWFQKEYPELFANLRRNQNRLTTAFDLHATLLDILGILKAGVEDNSSRVMTTERGISLFHEIPDTRTCEDASIPASWCVCMKHEAVSVKDERVVQAADFMVDAINNKTRPLRDLCATLRLSSIVDAYARVSPVLVRGTNKKAAKTRHGGEDKGGSAHFLITIETKPNGARYEATVRYDSTKDEYHVLGDIGRNNLYRHQADCVQDAVMRLFCYCKEKT